MLGRGDKGGTVQAVYQRDSLRTSPALTLPAGMPLPASRDGIRVRAPQGRWGWAIGRVSPGVRTAI